MLKTQGVPFKGINVLADPDVREGVKARTPRLAPLPPALSLGNAASCALSAGVLKLANGSAAVHWRRVHWRLRHYGARSLDPNALTSARGEATGLAPALAPPQVELHQSGELAEELRKAGVKD